MLNRHYRQKLLRQGVFFAWIVACSDVLPRLHGWPVAGEWLPLLRRGLQGAVVGFVVSMTVYWLIYRRKEDAQ
jgi:hypothetical protein